MRSGPELPVAIGTGDGFAVPLGADGVSCGGPVALGSEFGGVLLWEHVGWGGPEVDGDLGVGTGDGPFGEGSDVPGE